MRYIIGFIAGIATAYAALAIYRTIPPMGDFDAEPTA